MADTSSAPIEKKAGSVDDGTVNAINLLAQGKRNLVVGDMAEAVSQLQEACRLLAGKFGETADECADAYLAYGKALLDLARMENAVFGNALQGNSENEEESEDKSSTDEKADDSDKMTAEEKEKLSEDIVEAMVEREDEKLAKAKKKIGEEKAESTENGAVENGNGEGEKEEGEEEMETEEKADADDGAEVTEVKDETVTDSKVEKDSSETMALDSDGIEGEKVEKKAEESAKNLANGDTAEVNGSNEAKTPTGETVKEATDDAPASNGKVVDEKLDDGTKTQASKDGETKEDDKTETSAGDEDVETKEDKKAEVSKEDDLPNTDAAADVKGKDEKMETDKEVSATGKTAEAENAAADEKRSESKEESTPVEKPAESGKQDDVSEDKVGVTSKEIKGSDEEIGGKVTDDKADEKENGAVVEKTSTECEENGDTEMECEDANNDEGDESSAKEGDTEEEEVESEDIAEDEGEVKEGEKEGEEKEGDGKEEPTEEDVSNLQLAWEVLELARTIYKRHEVKEMKLKRAETLLKLGEVGLETEQYEQAVSDFKDCLTIQQECLEAEDRLLAETHYQLGLAYTFDTQYDLAIENFKSAAGVIEAKISQLKKIMEDGEKEGKGKDLVDFDDPVYKARKEVSELMEILPDIKGKLEDVEDEKKNVNRVKAVVMENVDFGTTTTGFGASTSAPAEAPAKEITNITHLVRKKRKPDDEPAKEDEAAKKQKVVEEGGGDAATKVNGKVNGTKTSPAKAMEGDAKTKTVEDVQKSTETTQSS